MHKLNTTQNKQTTQTAAKQNYTLVQSPFTTLGQETRWAYSTTLWTRAHTGPWCVSQ